MKNQAMTLKKLMALLLTVAMSIATFAVAPTALAQESAERVNQPTLSVEKRTITASWDSAEGAEGFVIKYSVRRWRTGEGFGWGKWRKAEVSGEATEWSKTFKAGDEVRVKVRALGSGQHGKFSPVAKTSIMKPGFVRNVALTDTEDGFNVTWDKPKRTPGVNPNNLTYSVHVRTKDGQWLVTGKTDHTNRITVLTEAYSSDGIEFVGISATGRRSGEYLKVNF